MHLPIQLGVKSVRKELEAAFSKAEGFNKKKMELATQASKIKQTLNYERSANKADKVKELEAEVAGIQAKLQKGEKQEAANRQSRQAQEADLEEQVCLPPEEICTSSCVVMKSS